jgi:RES domain-containing protein
MPVGTHLFRARIMPLRQKEDTEPLPLSEMGAPPTSKAVQGRINPDGIACFYAALDPNTAIAEVRPWNTARVTVAQFTTKIQLDVLDLTGQLAGIERTHAVWWIAEVISRPVYRDDRHAYLGTQYLSERVKAEGVAGLSYGSSMYPTGTNVALYSEYGLLPKSTSLHQVMSVVYETIQLAPRSAA